MGGFSNTPKATKGAERIPPRGSNPLRKLLKLCTGTMAKRQVPEKIIDIKGDANTLLPLHEAPQE